MGTHYAKLYADRHYVRSVPVDDRLYSAFMEHLGSVIYGGIYNPGHPAANKDGFREDVIRLVKELGITSIRYPGGNFVCSYNWEDGVGPKEKRPVRVNHAWSMPETNEVGPAEFELWTKAIGSDIMMAVNLSSRGPMDAANFLEYCNYPGGTSYSDLRKEHGHPEPYGIRTWCLGNEVDGPWNMCQKEAHAYGLDAREAAKAMRRIDQDVELVAVGSSGTQLATYLDWDREVLEQCYDQVDMISLHRYLGMMEIEGKGTFDLNDAGDYLELSARFDRNIEDVIAVCDYVKGRKQSAKTMYISLDEYNAVEEDVFVNQHEGNSMRTCLLFGLAMITLIRRSDRIKVGCQSILIGDGGGGLVCCGETGDAWVNGSYYIFRDCSRYGRGRVIDLSADTDHYDTKSFSNAAPVLSAAVYHEESGEIDIFVVNKTDEDICFDAGFGSFGELELIEHTVLTSPSLTDRNSMERPDVIKPQTADGTLAAGCTVTAVLRPYSWNVIRVKQS